MKVGKLWLVMVAGLTSSKWTACFHILLSRSKMDRRFISAAARNAMNRAAGRLMHPAAA